MRNASLKQTLAVRKRKVLRRIQHKSESNDQSHKRFKKACHSSNPTYLSSKLTEYRIIQDDSGLFIIKKYQGGRTPSPLQGRWSAHSEAERVLVEWLEQNDKTGFSRYPGKQNKRVTEYHIKWLGETAQ